MDWITDTTSGARLMQAMVPMRDGVRLNTFVFLPPEGARFPAILHRTPYGIAAAEARDKYDVLHAWLPNPAETMRGSILRGWRAIVAHGYAAVYQDCRGRHGSEGEDRVYADDAADGYDTLDWIAAQNWRTVGSACRARRPARPRPSPPPRPATRACARFSPRPAAPASMTT